MLATSDDLKRFMKGGLLAVSEIDDVLDEALLAASATIETYCSRRFASASYVEYYGGSARGVIQLDQWPVSAIAEVSDFGDVLTIGTDPSAGNVDVLLYYQPDVEYVARIERYVGGFVGGSRSVKVTYTAGYSAIPADLRRACCNLAAIYLYEPQRIGLSSTSTERSQSAFDRDLPKPLLRVLDGYRRVHGIGA